MNILYFVFHINGIGGYSRIIIDKVNWLVEHGFQVSICTTDEETLQPTYYLDPRVRRVVCKLNTTPGNLLHRFNEILSSIGKIKKVIEDESPDLIVNAHVPIVTWILPFIKREINKIIEIHLSRQGMKNFDQRFFSFAESKFHTIATAFIYSRYKKFVCLTNADSKAWKCGNSVVIHNFSEFCTDVFEQNRMTNKQIVLLGRLGYEKRFDLMVEIWSKIHSLYPDWKVLLYGDGELRPKIQRMIDQNGISESFILRGNTMDVDSALQASSIFCQTSEYEGFSVVLVEAMQKGLPIVAFDYSGIDDAVVNAKNGFVVPFGDIDSYCSCLRRLMDSLDLRLELRKEALQKSLEFDKNKIMNQWVNLFNECITDNS